MSDEPQPVPGDLRAAGLRIAIVTATFNREVTDGLLAGARAMLDEVGATIEEFEVPGAFELPVVALHVARAGYDAVVALGAVIEGETDHYEHVAHRASEGLMRVSLDTGIPVGFGLLTVRDREHALARSRADTANKGAEAAGAVLRTLVVLDRLAR